MIRISVLSVALLCLVGCGSQAPPSAGPATRPNVILIIGDGMDDQQITIGRNYLVGNDGELRLDGMPFHGVAQVQTVAEGDPAIPVYVGDSASGGTAMATGQVTSIGRAGTAAHTDEDIVNIMELAQAAGLGTGIVTTAHITDATPASFVAHINNRYCEGPDDMVAIDEELPQESTDCSGDYLSAGGPGSVAEQIAASKLDIILGGGLGDFEQFVEGSSTETVLDRVRDNGALVVLRGDELDALPGTGRVVGLFAEKEMPELLRGTGDRKAQFIRREGIEVHWPEPFACEDNPDFSGMPTLAGMTQTALEHLEQQNGFVLMVESSSIDKAAHYWRPCGHIGEMAQIDEALGVALEYAKANPQTLVLVTADHGQAAQLIPDTSYLGPQGFAPVGRFARIRTPEGGIMGISYATNDSPHWEEHSGVQVPVYAFGPGAAELPPYMRQVDVFTVAASHLGLAARQ